MEPQGTQPCKEDFIMPQDIEKRFQHLLNEESLYNSNVLKEAQGCAIYELKCASNKDCCLSLDVVVPIINLKVQPVDALVKANPNDKILSSTPVGSSLLTLPASYDQKTPDSDNCHQDTWNELCKLLCDEDLSPKNRKSQENSDFCLANVGDKLICGEQKLLEEKDRLLDAQNSLLKYEESLLKRERLLRQQQQAAAEREREAVSSLSVIQKRAADLVDKESMIQEKRQNLEQLEKQLENTLHDMQVKTETMNSTRLSVQEQELQVIAREKSMESQLSQVKDERSKLEEEWKTLKEAQAKLEEQQILENKEKEASNETLERLTAKETMLKSIEKKIQGKYHTVESLARKLNAREKLLKNIKKQSAEERIHIDDIIIKLDVERKSLEEAKADLELSRGNLNAARESLSKERDEADLYIKAMDEKIKERENRLTQQEEEILKKQELLEGIETEVKSEQQRYHMLRTKVQKEQEKFAEDLTEQESNLRKREAILERKEEEMKKSVQKLNEKRNLADTKLKQLKDIETRMESLENELQKRHQEHLQKVERHSKDHQNQLEHLDTVKHDLQQKSADLGRRFQEVRALKKEVRIWQKEAEKDLNNKAEEFQKERADLELQKQNLKNVQYDVERAGARVIDNMMNLDQASTKLDTLWEKLDGAQQKMQMISHHIVKQHKFLRERETQLGVKEEHVEALQKEWEKRNEELINKETTLRSKEQALNAKEETSNEESVLKAKVVKEGEQNVDSSLKIHYTITEEKFKVRKHVELPKTPLQEHIHHLGDEHETKRSASSTTEHQAAVILNLEMLQQEFARIMEERESLKSQQHELEETKNEVQDAKLTLSAQLKATKEMVNNASITAQKAFREREALEQERKRLGKAQKDIEATLSAREAKLSFDEKKLEQDLHFLKEERERVMAILHKAGHVRQFEGGMETNGIASKQLVAPTNPTSPGWTSSHPFNDHQPQLLHDTPTTNTAHTNSRFDLDMINLWRENECAKIETEKRMIMDEISRLHCEQQDDVNQPGSELFSDDAETTCLLGAGGAGKNSYQLFHHDLGPSLEALQLPWQGSYDVYPCKYHHPPVSEDASDESFSGRSEASSSRDTKHHVEDINTLRGDYPHFQDMAPSQTRLANVMQSLVNARQASRSRLQRTKNLLQALPFSGGESVTAEVQQMLSTLTERLNVMEQMEDELAVELREAYRIELPDSEGMIVDKVALLCKMEEQQTLRAEWEEDMQCQLESISILQANSQASSCFSTPIKRTVFDRIVSPPSTN